MNPKLYTSFWTSCTEMSRKSCRSQRQVLRLFFVCLLAKKPSRVRSQNMKMADDFDSASAGVPCVWNMIDHQKLQTLAYHADSTQHASDKNCKLFAGL